MINVSALRPARRRAWLGYGALVALAFSALLVPAAAQKSQQELAELRAEKLAKPVFARVPWRLDFDAAKAEAKADGKLLFAYFTRSYAY